MPPLYHQLIAFSFISLLILIFISVSPRYSSVFFPSQRAERLQGFITNTQSHGLINAQDFWKLREMYYPGILTFNKNAYPNPFVTFKSDKITSYESLIPLPDLNRKWPPVNITGKKILFENKNELIYFEEKNVVRIVFIKPISEMITANAFYDYKDKDKKLLQDKAWYVTASVKID
ncbi:hypothetical protein COY90_05385 [Candidatus Roizmanbacteria bacterium CG_4_10_14_0_8_um_filter_39_9]|uniref:Uncharacterized protein n=1 Tax=Candidatus Roizmanbacteria bacterium CG_4_10_14_0_8_um_filter_39_9 TaxID=1974829 RepID=A0A2M7QCP2_9BACT|nr:MAG: hypothetical protein COY90_05385 [Candidatus Roizmanbacteria bacterium CG_4_10_14_0_8_um_filter_39_9]